jgi:hypothetical protein
MDKFKLAGGFSLLLALALLGPIAAHAQTTITNRASNFEIIAVDGNELVVSDQLGTRELTVPPDFKFTVDGKSVGVSDLHAGMKGTAIVSTTTIQRPVYVTTIKKGTVIAQTARSIQIKEDTGKIHKFTQSEIDKRGVRLYMGDKAIRLSQLNTGDKVSATIVTESQPEILTMQGVDAQLAAEPTPTATAPAPEPEPVAAATQATEPSAEPVAEPAVEPAPEPAMEQAAPAPAPEATAPAPETPKPFFKYPFFMLILFTIIIALIWAVMRQRAKKTL